MERTTEQHRADVEARRATAPNEDHNVFESPRNRRESRKQRHKDLAELASLLEFYRRPDGIAEGGIPEPATPLKSNWRLLPANDNVTEEGYDVEQAVEYIPSVKKIKESLKGVDVTYRQEPMMLADDSGFSYAEEWEDRREVREVHAVPTGGDVEYGTYVDDEGKAHKTIVRIGGLRFSDGTQTERGPKLSMGQVVEADIRMPVGAMLGARDKSTRDKGAVQDPVELACTLDYFAGENDPPGLFRAQFAGRPKKRKERAKRTGPKTKAEARQWLADAIANTPVMPPIKKCPDGFPAGPKNLAHLWPGLVKVATGSSGAQAWEEAATEFEARNEWHVVLQEMKEEHVQTLTKAMSAKNLAEIGALRGCTGKYAIEAGRILLIEANDNFLLAKKIATEARVA